LAVSGLVAAFGAWPGGEADKVASASSAQEDTMHVQIVTFNLAGMTDADFLKVGNEVFVPELVKVPGLLAKIWLHDAATNTYSGVYTWRDPQAMLDFAESELFKAFATSPNFVNITSRDFDLLEDQSRMTNGLPAAVPAR
jgi:Putative mono-oxygenase ydhR